MRKLQEVCHYLPASFRWSCTSEVLTLRMRFDECMAASAGPERARLTDPIGVNEELCASLCRTPWTYKQVHWRRPYLLLH
jgi:hypothetical protein